MKLRFRSISKINFVQYFICKKKPHLIFQLTKLLTIIIDNSKFQCFKLIRKILLYSINLKKFSY